MMKRYLMTAAGAAALSVLAGGASAATPYDWSGFYVGFNAGWEDTKGHTDPFSEQVQQFSNATVAGDTNHTGAGLIAVPSTTAAIGELNDSRSNAIGGGQLGF